MGGEPDECTGARPGFLRRDDWHISSTKNQEECDEEEGLASIVEREGGALRARREEGDEDDIEFVFSAEDNQFMQLEDDISEDRVQRVAAMPMPSSWQEYQHLQQQLERLETSQATSAEERDEAAGHLRNLEEGYEQFKAIVSEGWELQFDPSLENALTFVVRTEKANKV